MGVHTYPCPTCRSPQKVRAESGEIVTIKECDACAQTREYLAEVHGLPYIPEGAAFTPLEQPGLEKELNEELDRYARRRKR